VVHHCAKCDLEGGVSVRRCSVCAAAPCAHPTHRRRAHLCDAYGYHPHRRPPASLFPCSSSTTFPLCPHVPCPRLETPDLQTRPILFATPPLLRPPSLCPVLLHHLPALAPLRRWYGSCRDGAVRRCLFAVRGRLRRPLRCGAGAHGPAVADATTVGPRPRTPPSPLPRFCSRALAKQAA